MLNKNEFYKAKARINSFKKHYGGKVIVKIDNDLQPPQEEFVFVEEEVLKNRFITTPERTWKEEMKAGKLHFEPHGTQPALKVFKDETEIATTTKLEQTPETPTKKKKRFCCCF
uniref:Uncharacterized protein n=1 Tax=Panagrolaimus sp. ES5 TaxID=591445 RepID=A0AC34GI03_9BILA